MCMYFQRRRSECIALVTQEMFPTTVRGFVMGFFSSLGRVASSIAQVSLTEWTRRAACSHARMRLSIRVRVVRRALR